MTTTKLFTVKKLSFQLLLLLSLSLRFQAQNWLWAKNYGNMLLDSYYNIVGQTVCADGSGNVLLAGQYLGASINFGSYTLTNTSFTPAYNSDVFLVKHDASGNVLWAKNFGCSGNDYIYGVCVDASNNIFITGMFSGSSLISVGMVLGTYTVMGGGGAMFLAKLDPSGNVLWVNTAGGTYAEQGRAVCTDAGGNVYVAGASHSKYFTLGTATFTTTSSFTADFFIAKYDPAGNLLWARTGGGFNSDYANAIAADASGNVVVAGEFRALVMVLGTQTLSNAVSSGNTRDAFIAKYDASGNFLWAKAMTGSCDETIRAISLDGNSNILVTGRSCSSVLTCGTATLNKSNITGGDYDFFIAKYNTVGNFLWAKSHGSSGNDDGYSISTDAGGFVYATGGFGSPTAVGSVTLSGSDDIFVCKYDPSGNALGALALNGITNEYGTGICCDGTGHVYVTGYLPGLNLVNTMNFGNIALVNNGVGRQVYLAKLSGNFLPTGINSLMKVDNRFVIFPNPAQNNFNLKLSSNENFVLKLYTSSGAIVKDAILNGTQNDEWLMDTSELPNGIYFVQLIADDELYSGKLVIKH